MNDNNRQNQANINWYPGHMAKTKREIREKLNLIDIIIEVIDARIPFSSKNKEIDELSKNKPHLLIMTKKDLCDLKETTKWVNYYQKKGYRVLLLDLMHENEIKKVFTLVDEMTKDLKEKWQAKGIRMRKIRALVLGIPNVGKSTLINRLTGKKVTNVGNKPGITKSLEWIRVNEKLELLDTPGILWPRLDDQTIALHLASMSAIKEEVLPKDEVAIYIIQKLMKDYPSVLNDKYNITLTVDIVEVLDMIAKKIGAYKPNDIDYERVYLQIIHDMKNGRLGKVTFDKLEEQ